MDTELLEAKRFHSHLGPYLVIGMKMGNFIRTTLGDKPLSYRIHTSVGLTPPTSCVIDGLQITTPCTVGNSMIRVEVLGDIAAWVQRDDQRIKLQLKPTIRERIDKETTRDNEEEIAEELWQADTEELFDIDLSSS